MVRPRDFPTLLDPSRSEVKADIPSLFRSKLTMKP
jgi:hypothetical protein